MVLSVGFQKRIEINNKLLIFIVLVFLIGHSWCPHVRTAGVRMWLDIGHHKSYDGTKMSYQKTPRDKDDQLQNTKQS